MEKKKIYTKNIREDGTSQSTIGDMIENLKEFEN
jgi:hypothetical protein